MIRPNNPDIDVAQLMERVRREAADIRAAGIPDVRTTLLDENVRRVSAVLARGASVVAAIRAIEKANARRSQLPRRLRPLGRFGGAFVLRVWNYFFKEQREKDALIIRALYDIEAMVTQATHLSAQSRGALIEPPVSSGFTALDDLSEQRARLDRDESDIRAISESLDAKTRDLRASIEGAERDLQALNARLAALPDATTVLRTAALLRADVASLRARIDGVPPAEAATPVDVETEPRLLPEFDALYMAIEDRFRGTRATIEDRLERYIPFLAESGVVRAGSPLLDLGCGRGDLLRIAGRAGLPAAGVDSNGVAVAEAQLLGLDVENADLFSKLHATPSQSVGAVSAIHVIEHLPFDRIFALCKEAKRVLVPGGLLLIETPNPANLRVAASTFFLDPTHRAPVPAQLASFLIEYLGFIDVRVEELHPPDDAMSAPADLAAPLYTMTYGPQDYAILARVPAT